MRLPLAMTFLAISALAVLPSAADAHVGATVIFPAPRVAPAALSLLPRGVYFHRTPGVDVYFADGFWWAPWRGAWYRATMYEGPWSWIEPAYVPSEVVLLPPQVRYLLPRASLVPWRTWRDTHYYGPGYRQDRRRGLHSDAGLRRGSRFERVDHGRPGMRTLGNHRVPAQGGKRGNPGLRPGSGRDAGNRQAPPGRSHR